MCSFRFRDTRQNSSRNWNHLMGNDLLGSGGLAPGGNARFDSFEQVESNSIGMIAWQWWAGANARFDSFEQVENEGEPEWRETHW
ncbi:hypothetical protein L1987_29136 [Smallanthus sonchifolius]|uniref:Uncharacterized protein n=1 Tax=Smallanthus sonchifolius TaxID=185202 RepID=A0ACB9I0Y8_9ASTR|nr:hypothetical protein L1987_29136 [Smallanthus sonchifolius]